MTEDFRCGALVSQELIDVLNAVFPADRPRIADTERSIFLRSGQREVVEYLTEQFNLRFEQAHKG